MNRKVVVEHAKGFWFKWNRAVKIIGGTSAAIMAVVSLWLFLGFPTLATSSELNVINNLYYEVGSDYISNRKYELNREQRDIHERLVRPDIDRDYKKLLIQQLDQIRFKREFLKDLEKRLKDRKRQK